MQWIKGHIAINSTFAALQETELSQLCRLIAPGYSANQKEAALFLDTEKNNDDKWNVTATTTFSVPAMQIACKQFKIVNAICNIHK